MFVLLESSKTDPIFTEQMNVSRYLLNTARLWHEINPSADEDLLECISKLIRCPKRPPYTCAR